MCTWTASERDTVNVGANIDVGFVEGVSHGEGLEKDQDKDRNDKDLTDEVVLVALDGILGVDTTVDLVARGSQRWKKMKIGIRHGMLLEDNVREDTRSR